MLVACNKRRFTEVFLRYESPTRSSHVFCDRSLLSEAEELAGIYKMERTVTIQDIYSVLLVSAGTRSCSAP